MDALSKPNFLLEALAYLGARANGHSLSQVEAGLRARGIQDLGSFREATAPLVSLAQNLDAAVSLSPDHLQRFFTNLPGFSYSTIGLYSPAFLLFYPMLSRYNGDFDALVSAMFELSPDHLARHILLTLDYGDCLDSSAKNCSEYYMDQILSLQIPAESKLVLLDLHRNFSSLLPDICTCIRPVLQALETQSSIISQLANSFSMELSKTGCDVYLRNTSSLSVSASEQYQLRPFLLGYDTNLSLAQSEQPGPIIVYCGILRQFLTRLLHSPSGMSTQVLEAIKLLGDKTRFDILCQLREQPAYGQELSERFGLSRNTIHHHMSKLLNAGFVNCRVDGNRIYYTTNKVRIDSILEQMHFLLCGRDQATASAQSQR